MIKTASAYGAIVCAMAMLPACATGVKRGVVVMKVSDREAHVGISKDEVSPGDHVELYKNVCTGSRAGKEGGLGPRSCTKEETGHGKITRVLSNDYSVVEFEPGTTFSEGDTIEKHAH